MWLKKLLNIINKPTYTSPPPGFFTELSKVNPEKFYVENVRSVLGITTQEARQIIEEGVASGTFLKGTEILCPDDVVAASIDTPNEIPETVECWEEIDGDYEPIEHRSAELAKRTYYRFATIRQT